ncbi:conserved hypothetical protein [Candidatus Accumulibacter aalborgensis]|uniref:Uncharacterized protein n=1 Tax=Candidatus Accumulibacter aalborgensis TaxID=1860102 RepID=A0A1A8XJZ5_9PROT|nr:hypothetical protein [Candidatus Accumulibacter aalborgensis]SBT04268.1 conserved hypothetical protein [Candidatus Accumulibacter aalborgensis]
MTLFVVLLASGLIIAAIVWWRALLRQRARYIDSYPYAKYLDRRLAARRPELTAAQRKRVFDGLREYFQLCREAGNRLVAMPSQAVDDAWHEFILFTRQYHQFCDRGLGRFLHHTPAEAMRTPTDAQDGIKRAWRLSCRRQGIDAQAPKSLPTLFALDATLGIVGGFVYRLDCLAAPTGSDFCAGHIGCGGSCSGSTGGSGDSSGGDSSGGDAGDGGGSSGDGCGGGGGCGGD